jgi:hypothetical protein
MSNAPIIPGSAPFSKYCRRGRGGTTDTQQLMSYGKVFQRAKRAAAQGKALMIRHPPSLAGHPIDAVTLYFRSDCAAPRIPPHLPNRRLFENLQQQARSCRH